MKTSTITKTDGDELAAMVEETKKMYRSVDFFLNQLLAKQAGLDEIAQPSSTEFFQEEKSNSKDNTLDSTYLREISYRLRGPLTLITGWTEILINEEVDVDITAKALSSIRRNARCLLDTIEEFECKI